MSVPLVTTSFPNEYKVIGEVDRTALNNASVVQMALVNAKTRAVE